MHGAGFGAAQAGVEPVGRFAQLVDGLEVLLDFNTRRHVAALFLQVFGHVGRERIGGLAAPVEDVADDIRQLVRRDVAHDARKFFLEIGLGQLQQVAKALGNLGVARDADRRTTQAVFGARPDQREQRQRRAGECRVDLAGVTRVERDPAASNAQEKCDRRALEHEREPAPLELPRQRRGALGLRDVAVQQR